MAEKFKNLVEVLEKSAKTHATRTLFGTKQGSEWKWIDYQTFKRDVDRFRAALKELGVGPGDKVAVIADNRVEWAVGCYATYGLRAAYVPMYQAQKPDEWKFILGDCDAKVVLAANQDVYDKLKKIQPELPALEHVINFEGNADSVDAYSALLKKGEQHPVDPEQPDPKETAGFIYTSGTTGNPKGVILSHSNICSNLNAIHEVFTFNAEDRSLSFLPWAHSMGQTCELHGLISMGCSIGINDDIPNLVGNLAEVKPTVLFAVPRIFNRIYDGVNKQMSEKPGFIQGLFRSGIKNATRKNAGESLGMLEGMGLGLADKIIFNKIRDKFGGRLKYAISGSAALDKTVAEFVDALGIMVYEGYGLTETSPIATANYPGHRKIGSVGRAIPGVTIKIDTVVTGDAVNGEIVIYGPNIMQGYHNRPEENAAVLMDDGGFRSGDMGRLDDDGYLYITGRIKEQYKLENGKYVVPAPLEEKLKLSPFIANVMIHGHNKPHNVAIVVPDPDALKAWAAENGVDVAQAGSDPKVKQLIQGELDKFSKDFKGFERPRNFAVITEDFSTENGMLTPTLKLKRRNVLERYGDLIEGLY
ncbi:MAG: long-chain fatty acid--CoA ligase [Polyangiaceae bacterium]|nr:long-chain fatty acid--CoA ligase [Polyangiaceae bacterium]MCB9606251.1 long-chain fatty acid--CoA ligase [Polyangiaceae bacterium]